MAQNLDCFLLIFLTFASYQMAASEDCALAAAKPDKKINPMEVNARRQEIKYKFGITIPHGAYTFKGYSTRIPDKIYRVVTPPTNFFPKGSSPITVTLLPWTHLYQPFSRPDEWFCVFMKQDCLRAYDTGPVCGKALHYAATYTFLNYCSLEYSNCITYTKTWQVAYFGRCPLIKIEDSGLDYDIEGDNFWEQAVINIPPFNPITGLAETMFRKK